jgi:putative phosphoesterase
VRVAALYDVHGNAHALEAVLAEVEREGVDLVVAGGDVVAGPFPVEALDLLSGLGERCVFVRGNGDREVVESDDAQSVWCRERLGPRIAAVAAWPLVRTLDVGGLGTVVFCHATPASDNEIVTRLTPDAEVAAAFPEATVAVVGHTHVQFDRTVGDLRVVNAGSVGWPYEDAPGARWALLRDGVVELRATAYDVEAAAAAIRASGYPEAEEAARGVVEPPGAEAASAYFEGRRGA